MDPTELIWMNGDFVPWEEAKVHVDTEHNVFSGSAAVRVPLAVGRNRT